MTTGARHPNVDFLRRGFDALASGDMETVLAQFHEDFVYYGFDATGTPHIFEGRDAFFTMMRETFALVAESSNELGAVHTIGDDIVVAEVRARRRGNDGSELDTVYAMTFRIEDEHITYGNDMIGRSLQDFWRNVTSTPD